MAEESRTPMTGETESKHFIHQFIDEDIAEGGRFQGMTVPLRYHFAFLQFQGHRHPNFALSPYFCGLGQFDRIIEIGEQTGPFQEIFKNFLKMVPICSRFLSYY